MPLFSSSEEGRGGGIGGGQLLVALAIAAFSVISYLSTRQSNPITGKTQHIGITPDQEIALGLQAEPQMEQQYGGESNDAQARAHVERVGQRIVEKSDASKTPYKYQYHLLADPQTINAFALPGGQIFITEALYKKLSTEGQLAGVLGHETGHVVARHSAEQIAKTRLTQGLTGAAVIATYDPSNPSSRRDAAVAALVGQLVTMRFSRQDESEADALGVKLMEQAGYDPHAMIGVMEVLQKEAGGGRQPEFFSTHPNPAHRIEQIQADIQQDFPDGVPGGLEK
jgi:beta-barrel assembly-enhancing protease